MAMCPHLGHLWLWLPLTSLRALCLETMSQECWRPDTRRKGRRGSWGPGKGRRGETRPSGGSAVARQHPPSTKLQGDPAIPVFQVRILRAPEVGVAGSRMARSAVLPASPDMCLSPRAEPKLSGPCGQHCTAAENTGRPWGPRGGPQGTGGRATLCGMEEKLWWGRGTFESQWAPPATHQKAAGSSLWGSGSHRSAWSALTLRSPLSGLTLQVP